MNPIDIVVLTYLRQDFTIKCLQHIAERTKRPYRLILVVNGTDLHESAIVGQYRALQEKGIIDHLLLIGDNYGVHAGKNVALPLVHSEPYYIDMDNDILVPDLEPDWTVQLEQLMDKYPNFGSISLRPQVLIGRSGEEFNIPDEVVKFSHSGAHGRIMRTAAVKKSGGWRQTWDALRNNEDRWIAEQLKNQGLDTGYAKNLRTWHQFGSDELDPWGYPKSQKPEDHGHREIWPPVNKVTDIKDYDLKTWNRK